MAVLAIISCLHMTSHASADNAPSEVVIIKSPEDYAKTPWAKLNIPLGTKLLTRKIDNDKELHRLEFVGGVSMWELEDGEILSVDHSGGGAILCLQFIYVDLKNMMDKCRPEETEIRETLDLAIEKIENFIVTNSLSPVTKAELENARQTSRDKFPVQCELYSEVEGLIPKKTELERFQKSIDASIATPRPPVIETCL